MSLEKLNIPTKIDNAAKQRLVASNLIDTNETLLANEVNDIVAKTNELVEAYNFGGPISAFNFKDNVATYANLPRIGNEVNDGYGVIADGLVYVWNGLSFPDEGKGIDLGLKATGQVKEGETRGVNGNEVFFKTAPISLLTEVNGGEEYFKNTPEMDYLNHYSFTTNTSTDTYYWDIRNIVNKGDLVKKVKVLIHSAGIISIIQVRGNEIIFEKDFPVVTGLNEINTSDMEIIEDCYIGIRTKTANIKLGTDSSGFFIRKVVDTGIVSNVNFRFAYEIALFKINKGIKPAVETLNSEVFTKSKLNAFPEENYLDSKTFSTSSGVTESIYFDTRCIVTNSNQYIQYIRVNHQLAGKSNIVILSLNYQEIESIEYTAKVGVNKVMLPKTVETSFYIGVRPHLSSLRLGADNSGFFKKITQGVVTNVNFRFAYEVIFEDLSESVLGRLHNIELQIFVPKLFDLQKEINRKNHIFIPEGIHILEQDVFIPAGKKIEGIKGKSIIKAEETARIGLIIDDSNDISFQDFVLKGIAPDIPTDNALNPVSPGVVDTFSEAYAMKGKGLINGLIKAQTGVRINGGERIILEGMEITNFSEHGLHTSLSGKRYKYAIQVLNNYINNNYSGIKTDNEAERSYYAGNYVTLNQIGMYMDSGTNMVDNNSFNANRVGMVLADGYNHAHGVISNSPFTHASLFGIVAYNIEHGQLFLGCKFGYGDVYLFKSKGLQFESSQLIGNLKITVDGFNDKLANGVNSFANSFSNTGNVTTEYLNGGNTMRLKNNWTPDPSKSFNTSFNN